MGSAYHENGHWPPGFKLFCELDILESECLRGCLD